MIIFNPNSNGWLEYISNAIVKLVISQKSDWKLVALWRGPYTGFLSETALKQMVTEYVFIEPFLSYFLASLRVMIFTIKSPHLSWLKAVPRLVKFTVLDGNPFCATVIPALMQSWSLADSTSVWRCSSNPFYRDLDLHNIRSTKFSLILWIILCSIQLRNMLFSTIFMT